MKDLLTAEEWIWVSNSMFHAGSLIVRPAMTCITAFKDTFRGSFPASSLDSLLRRASSRWFPEKIGIVNYVIKCTVINSNIWVATRPESLHFSAIIASWSNKGEHLGWFLDPSHLLLYQPVKKSSRFPHLREQKSMNVCVCVFVFVAFKSWSHGESPCFRWFEAINPSQKTAI